MFGKIGQKLAKWPDTPHFVHHGIAPGAPPAPCTGQEVLGHRQIGCGVGCVIAADSGGGSGATYPTVTLGPAVTRGGGATGSPVHVELDELLVDVLAEDALEDEDDPPLEEEELVV